MATVIVNGESVELDNKPRNLVQAAKLAGVEIPHYCYHEALSVVASCRMCLVEVGDKKPDGTIAMQPKLLPACQTPAKDGTVVVTNSAKVKQAQAGTLEYLLLNHPLDCPTCDQAGECYLQDYSFKYGNAQTRLREPKIQKIDKNYIGENITLFTDRCVMCSRCVRFTREISGTAELQIINRGAHAEIDIFPGEPCNNKLAGNVVDICPVGALCSKDFLYQQRVWWLHSKPSVCSGCSTGCSIKVDQNHDFIYRLQPRVNPNAQGHFMCDEGRFGYKYANNPDRLKEPKRKIATGQAPVAWDDILRDLKSELGDRARIEPETMAAVLSPFMTVEEAYLLAKGMKELSPKTKLVLGPYRVVGEDDQYPKGIDGKPTSPTKFTIRAEKCPNRLGVEAVLKHFEGSVISFASLLKDVSAKKIQTVYLVENDPESSIDAASVQVLAGLEYLIVQGILPTPTSAIADVVLPAGAWSEREGVFVNHAGLAQLIERAVHTPGEARFDGRLLWDLFGGRGLFHSATIRGEIAREIDYFAQLPTEMPELGVMLTSAPAGVLAGS